MRSLFILFLLILAGNVHAQDTIRLNLKQVIELAQSDAPDVLLAKTRLNNNYWRYQSFLADYRPQIDLSVNSDFNRSVEGITQPDGGINFASRSLMTNFTGLSLRQDVAATGGQIFTRSGMQRLDIFATDINQASTSYLFSPISIEIFQPLFAYNDLKWQRRVEPLRFEESKLRYSEQMENLAFESASLFFQVLTAQLNVQATQKDKSNADTLYALSQGRFEVGRIAETELLQLELSARRADANLAQAQLDLQTANEALRNFLGITRAVQFQLSTPEQLPTFNIDPQIALSYARANRSKAVEFQRRLEEAQLGVARAKGQVGPNVNLRGTFGLQQTTQEFGSLFADVVDQERVVLGLEIPLADWGKARSQLEIARSQQDLERMNIQQERVNFEQEILLRVRQFDLVRNQVALARRTYEIAQKRNDITQKRYLIGKIDITELNIALNEQDAARRSYIASLQNFWLAYYELRSLTLYDFENNEPLVRPVEKVIVD